MYVPLCECASLPRLETATEVVVVMHRLEHFKSTNTGRLAVRLLARSSLVVRTEPAPPAAIEGAYVLFPHATAMPLEAARARGVRTLVVPDGTWHQAGRIARRDPLCVGLPRVVLASTRPSAYGLRASQRPDALCTLEAIAEALRVLEGDDVADRMHEALARWVVIREQIRRGAHAQRRAEPP